MARPSKPKQLETSSAHPGFESRLGLAAELNAQFAESAKLEAAIRANLESLNFKP